MDGGQETLRSQALVDSPTRHHSRERRVRYGETPGISGRLTDIFALGSTFYHIMRGHEPFLVMDSFDDEKQIEARFASSQFPKMESLLMNCMTHKCWAREYNSAEAVLQDLGSDAACLVAGGVREEAMYLGDSFCSST